MRMKNKILLGVKEVKTIAFLFLKIGRAHV